MGYLSLGRALLIVIRSGRAVEPVGVVEAVGVVEPVGVMEPVEVVEPVGVVAPEGVVAPGGVVGPVPSLVGGAMFVVDGDV